MINTNYKGVIKELNLFFFRELYDRKIPILSFSRINESHEFYKSYFKKSRSEPTKTTISTGKKDKISDEISGSSGESHPVSVGLGSREGEGLDSVKLCDLPTDYIPEVIQKRKNDFGIWISKVALRHFESLKCKLAIDDPIFQKIETYFIPSYGEYSDKNSWATPIDNEKKKELGICFGFQFTKYGTVRIHLSGQKDIEYFTTDFFEVFSKMLDDSEIVKFLEMLILERKEKPVFYVHDARHIGPKEIVDKEFKGAHIKVNEVHWFGKIKWDARIDYSEPMKPHIEGEGPMAQVGNFMKLIDGSPEFIANLSELRELNYRTGDTTQEIYKGVGLLSDLVLEVKEWQKDKDFNDDLLFQEFQDFQGNIKDIAELLKLKTDNEKIQTEILKNFNNALELGFDEIGVKIEDLYVADIVPSLKLLETKVDENHDKIIDELKEHTDTLKNEIKESSDEIKELIESEFETIGQQVKNNLYLMLRKLNALPGQTAKELSKELGKSQKTIYSYLKKLQDKHLIISQSSKKTSSRGRHARCFKVIYQKLKEII